MNDERDRLIVSQQLKIQRLEARIEEFKRAQKTIIGECISIGAPLNDNKLKYTHNQLAPFSRILSAIDWI